MVTVNDEQLWRDMWAYKDHGKSYAAVYERQHPPGFRWLHDSFGTNWRMLEMQAVIGRIQLRRMDEWRRQRTVNAEIIYDACKHREALVVPSISHGSTHAFYKCYVYVRPEKLASGWSRDRIVEEIVGHGVPCYQGSCSEVYLEKAFDGTRLRPEGRLPVAKRLGETSLMFLVHPTLTSDEISKTCDVITRVCLAATN